MSVDNLRRAYAQITSWSTESVVVRAEIKTVGSMISNILMCSTAQFDNVLCGSGGRFPEFEKENE